tara:strand:- start:1811 stop:3415 length:1605 start_codon:yes stop_codon:yes gene_type:complete
MKKCVIYARYSSEKQADSLSIEAQIDHCASYIKLKDYTLIDTYIDKAQSGTTDKRESFQKMIYDASNNEFDYVVVYSYDRFSRSRYDQVTYKHELKSYNVNVLSITQPIDHSNPDAVLLESIYEGMAESFSRKLSRETVRGSVQSAKLGFYTGGRAPYGYNINKVNYNGKIKSKLVVCSRESETVKMVYKLYLSGEYGYKAIAQYLNKNNYKPRSGDKFSTSTIVKILKNERYTGSMVWGKSKDQKKKGYNTEIPYICIPNSHEAIISIEDYKKVQSLITKRGAKESIINQYDYLLSNLLICSCGCKLVGHSAKSGKYHYYVCNGKVKKGYNACTTPMIAKELIENSVINTLNTFIFSQSNIKKVATEIYCQIQDYFSKKDKEIKRIDRKIPELKQKYNKLIDVIATTDHLSIEDIAPRIKEIKKEIEFMENEKRIMQKSKKTAKPMSDIDIANQYIVMIKQLINDGLFVSNSQIKKLIKQIKVNYPSYSIEYSFSHGSEEKVLNDIPMVAYHIYQAELILSNQKKLEQTSSIR